MMGERFLLVSLFAVRSMLMDFTLSFVLGSKTTV